MDYDRYLGHLQAMIDSLPEGAPLREVILQERKAIEAERALYGNQEVIHAMDEVPVVKKESDAEFQDQEGRTKGEAE